MTAQPAGDTPQLRHLTYLTAVEAAARFRVHPITIRRLAAAGRIPGALKLGGQWRIPETGLDALAVARPD